MKKYKNNNSKGFTAIEIVISLVVIAALAIGGLWVWQKNKSIQKQQADNSAQVQEQSKENAQVDKSGDPLDKYLVIKEWGVRMPLEKEIAGAYYELQKGDYSESISLYDSGFDELNNSNGVRCGGENKFQIYSISRAKADIADGLEDPNSPIYEGPGPDYEKFGFTEEYKFGGLGAHQAPPYCANLNSDPYGPYMQDDNIVNIGERKKDAFRAAFKNLGPVK